MKKIKKSKNKSSETTQNLGLNVGGSIEIRMGGDSTPMCVCICGAKSFKNYLPEIISVNLHKKCVNVCGKNLECVTFSGGVVELFGDISEINFG